MKHKLKTFIFIIDQEKCEHQTWLQMSAVNNKNNKYQNP